MKQFILLCLTVISLQTIAQQNTAIGSNEKLTYTASYNMSGLLTNIAQVSMTTEPVNTGKNNYLRLKCNAATYSKWDSFFKIRDLYESYVNPNNLAPYLYKRNIDEGGYVKMEKYVYNNKNKTIKATMQRRQNKPTTQSLPMKASTFDVVTTLYHIRNMDIDKAPVGSTHQLNLLFDRKVQGVTLSLLGKENVNTTVFGNKMCYKIAINSSNKALKGKNENIIYLTADKNKVPVLIKFSIPAGNGILTLSSASGLKN
ncbi:DUF3108 domain-containing protein [Aquimarina brevivitae]|uniref:Uncharacterized protein DUF3108 n=1 Tax=Aquimarina brevivitae TaxID=323412 RepID=A0A4Q7P3K3_9FLAO|nr:DUF3108 domain-containing protein [Aquimarina brevivitae]RZS93968.1 uncharacterized protein DUF3108 [Aquimarina brevivitae]